MLRELAGVTQLEEVAVEPDGDVRIVQQHVLKDARVAALGQRLPLIAEVTVIRGGPTRQAQHHRRVELSRVLVPLLLGVVLEDLVVQFRPDARQRRLLAVGELRHSRQLRRPRVASRHHSVL